MVGPNALVGKSYRLVERLGAGELGEVWSARHEKMGRDCALKLIHPAWPLDPKAIAHFLRDARSSGRLSQPALVELLDQGEHEGMPYVVMPLLRAEKLERLIERRGAIPPGVALRLVAEIAHGIAAAHEQRVFHLRIEAANVLLHRDAKGKVQPKLIDFGIARLCEGSVAHLISPLPYLAPEQLAGELGDGRADVWAMTTLVYHAVTGVLPFRGKTPADVLEDLDAGVGDAVQRVHAIDPKIAELLRDGWARDRSKRPLVKVFARRVRDLSARLPGSLDDLIAAIVIPESIAPSAIEVVEVVRAPKPPPLPKVNGERVSKRPPSSRGATSRGPRVSEAPTNRKASRRVAAIPPPSPSREPEPQPEPAPIPSAAPPSSIPLDVDEHELLPSVPPRA